MVRTIEHLIEQYGTIAIFFGCLAEGEVAAIVGGFFAREALLPLWQALVAAFFGTLIANTLLFLAGRNFAGRPFVQRMREKPGFGHALDLAEQRPRAFIFFNRFIYGMRLIAGTAAGLTNIPLRLFLVWNFFSAIVWAALFVGIGFFFGLGAEALVGKALHSHQRVTIGVIILIAGLIVFFLVAGRVKRREARLADQAHPPAKENNAG